MQTSTTRSRDFLSWLMKQARNRDDKKMGGEARKSLAELRRGARDRLHDSYDIGRVAPHIGEFLSEGATACDADEWLSVIGALFALNYEDVPQINNISLGGALRRLRDTGNGSDSLEARFMALLNSRGENLPGHLRQLIGLLASARKGLGLDWYALLQDVGRWDQSNRTIQKSWIRDYYRVSAHSSVEHTDNAAQDTEGETNDEN